MRRQEAPKASWRRRPSRRQPSRSWKAIAALAAALVLVTAFAVSRSRAVGLATKVSKDLPYPEVARISPADAKALLGSGRAVIVDVRGTDAYNAAHIDGALSMPLSEVADRLSELPRDKQIITYCT